MPASTVVIVLSFFARELAASQASSRQTDELADKLLDRTQRATDQHDVSAFSNFDDVMLAKPSAATARLGSPVGGQLRSVPSVAQAFSAPRSAVPMPPRLSPLLGGRLRSPSTLTQAVSADKAYLNTPQKLKSMNPKYMAEDARISYAYAGHCRGSSSKYRRIMLQIQGRSYLDALMMMEFMPFAAALPISKVLRNAAANAKQKYGLDPTSLVIAHAVANMAPYRKKYRARAQGRPGPIKKANCHVTIAVAPADQSMRQRTIAPASD